MALRLIPFLPMLWLLGWAAVQDLRTGRIRNWLTLVLAVGGLMNSFCAGPGDITPSQAVMGLVAGFAIPFVLFVLGALGGGDVKLLAGIGAWLGPVGVLEVFIVQAILGLLIVVAQCACTGRLACLLRNSALLAINLVHVGEMGVQHVSQMGMSCRSIDRPLPFAVPVLAATLIVLTMLR